jgi:hypothetical protein
MGNRTLETALDKLVRVLMKLQFREYFKGQKSAKKLSSKKNLSYAKQVALIIQAVEDWMKKNGQRDDLKPMEKFIKAVGLLRANGASTSREIDNLREFGNMGMGS